MILLDTNVISEAMKPEPDASVRDWLDELAAETLFLSAVTIAELSFDVAALPCGKRKDRVAAALEGGVDLFSGRIRVFDTAAARRYAELAVKARARGKGFLAPDGYIAAIAAANGHIVASRGTSPNRAAGLAVIDLRSAARLVRFAAPFLARPPRSQNRIQYLSARRS